LIAYQNVNEAGFGLPAFLGGEFQYRDFLRWKANGDEGVAVLSHYESAVNLMFEVGGNTDQLLPGIAACAIGGR
jgi:hypothetical protein